LPGLIHHDIYIYMATHLPGLIHHDI
jgi:hypothetical protein